jgi:hypothetical protein
MMRDDLLRVAAARKYPHHAVAGLEALHAAAGLGDFARELQAGDFELRLGPGLWIHSAALQQVRAIHRRRAHVDQQVFRAVLRLGYVAQLQHVRLAVLADDDRAHGYIDLAGTTAFSAIMSRTVFISSGVLASVNTIT